ncbi:MAG: TIGR02300 family protein [Sneathiella sp.]
MAKPEWGNKHLCNSCSKPFYDMKRKPIICPVCGVEHVPEKLLKSRKVSPAKSAPVKPVVPTSEGADSADDDEGHENVGTSVETDDDGDDEDISSVVSNKPTIEDR